MSGYIVFFDSGVGGVSVLREALSLYPYENYIYLADNLNVPYGKKSADEIVDFTWKSLEFLKCYNIKCLVLACNTATAVAAQVLRERLSYPVIGIEPNISERYTNCEKTLLVATSQTINFRKEKYVSKNIECLPCDELVLNIENAEFYQICEKIHKIIKYCNQNNIKKLILGCTHFVLVKRQFQNSNMINIIDGNYPTVQNMGRLLGLNMLERKECIERLEQLNLENVKIILTKKDEKKYNMIKNIASNGIIFQNPLETH